VLLHTSYRVFTHPRTCFYTPRSEKAGILLFILNPLQNLWFA